MIKSDKILDKTYWEARWQSNETMWDIGYASPAIVEYMKQYPDKNAAILIPGCGNAYEAEALLNNGYTNITLIDIAPKAVERLKDKFKNTSNIKVLCEDYFEHNGNYDLIIEQTFFCAILPENRPKYAKKSASLLRDNGKIIGVLFNRDFETGPPFGGSISEYTSIFKPHYTIKKMDKCYNSITPRKDQEVFIVLEKK